MSISYCFDCDRYVDTDEDGEFDHENNRCGSCTEKDPHGKKIRDCIEDHKRKEIEKVIKRTQDNLKHFALDGFDLEKTYMDAMNVERQGLGLEPLE